MPDYSNHLALLIRPSCSACVSEVVFLPKSDDLVKLRFCVDPKHPGMVFELVPTPAYLRMHADTPGLRIHASPDAYIREQFAKDAHRVEELRRIDRASRE